MDTTALELRAQDFLDVADDIELEAAGVRHHYVVDAADILGYSFPTRSSRLIRDEFDLSVSQIGFEHLFRVRGKSVVLLDEYLVEVESNLRRISEEVVSRTSFEVLDTLDDADEPSQLAERVKELNPDTFKRHLGVGVGLALGLFRTGAERLRYALEERTIVAIEQIGRDGGGEDQERIQEAVERARPDFDEGVRIAVECIEAGGSGSSKQSRGENLLDRERWRRDVRAIQRIIQINSSLGEDFVRGRAKHRHVFLYLSSASKTEALFEHPELEEAHPVLSRTRGEGSIWRTARHLFIRAGYAPSRSHKQGATQSDALREIGRSLAVDERDMEGLDVQEMTATATRRVVEDFADAGVTFNPVPFREALSLVNYSGPEELYKSIATLRDRLPHSSEGGGQEEETVVGVLTSAHGALVQRWAELLGTADADFNRGADAVVGTYQRFPLQIRFQDEVYGELFERARQLCLHPPSDDREFRVKLADVVREFAQTSDDGSGERELLMLFMLFVLPPKQGALTASEYARRAARTVKDRHVRQEFDYVRIWALRRAREFADAVGAASKAIDDRSAESDARFWQGRYLARYSWMVGGGGVSVFDMLADAEKAVALARTRWYEQDEGAQDPLSTETLLSSLNNAAYSRARIAMAVVGEDPFEAAVELGEADRKTARTGESLVARARESIDDLKAVATNRGLAAAPAHAHTEAYVEFAEAVVAREANDRVREASKLGYARSRAVEAADAIDSLDAQVQCLELIERIDRRIRERLSETKATGAAE